MAAARCSSGGFCCTATRCPSWMRSRQLTDVDADLLRAVGPNQKLDSGDDRALLQQAGWQRSALPPGEERGCADRHQVDHGGTQELPGRILIEINKKVGHRLVTKFGQRGVIDLAKLVPAVGGLIDATADGVGCHVIAVYAKSAFPALNRSRSEPMFVESERVEPDHIGCSAREWCPGGLHGRMTSRSVAAKSSPVHTSGRPVRSARA